MKNKRLYNFLVNTYDLSKETVLKHVESRLEELLDKHVKAVLQSNRIERMIVHRVCDYIKTGKTDYWSSDRNFEKIVNGEIKSIIEDYLRDRCEITFKFPNNSVRFITEDEK